MDLLERVADRVDTEQLFFPLQLLATFHLFEVGQADRRDMRFLGPAEQVENRELAAFAGLVDGGGSADQQVDDGKQLAAPTEAVEGTCFDQTFERAFVDLTQVDAIAEIFQALEAPPRLARSQKGLDRAFADILDSSHPKTDRAALWHRKRVAQAGVTLGFLGRVSWPDLDLKVQP